MTIRFTLTLAGEGVAADGRSTTRAITTAIERGSLTAETLGLTLAEGKAILSELQAALRPNRLRPMRRQPGVAWPVERVGASGAITRSPAAPPSARSLSRSCG